jgi:hypothetical protein
MTTSLRRPTCASLVAALVCALGCGSEPPIREQILDEASETHGSGSEPDRSRSGSAPSLTGVWRTKTYFQDAWVDLIWVIGHRHAWHVVTAYADEELTVPLLRWDVVRRFEIEGPSERFPDAHDLRWTDLSSTLVAYVDDPALLAAVQVDDCDLVPGEVRDTSTDDCGAPLFPFRTCELLDFVEIAGDKMTFGDPQQGDRCEMRPTEYEAWSFSRVPLTPDLVALLLFGPA